MCIWIPLCVHSKQVIVCLTQITVVVPHWMVACFWLRPHWGIIQVVCYCLDVDHLNKQFQGRMYEYYSIRHVLLSSTHYHKSHNVNDKCYTGKCFCDSLDFIILWEMFCGFLLTRTKQLFAYIHTVWLQICVITWSLQNVIILWISVLGTT